MPESKLLIKKHSYKVDAVGSAIEKCISAYVSLKPDKHTTWRCQTGMYILVTNLAEILE